MLVIRVADRVGKGIRNAPRDALIAESVDPSIRGRAFGFHRAADNAGGVRRAADRVRGAHLAQFAELRTVFWLAAIPGVLSVLVVAFAVRDIPRDAQAPAKPGARPLARRSARDSGACSP